MSECNKYIEIIYQHPKIAEFIRSIQPEHLQDDLKQEVALVLLNYNCKKIIEMYNKGELIKFTFGVIWKLGRLQKNNFYKVFKQNNVNKAIEYIKTLKQDNSSEQMIAIAKKLLNDKMSIDAKNAHESMIFHSYVELGTCKKVAEYYGIPKHHVDKVVSKCKAELKRKIKSTI